MNDDTLTITRTDLEAALRQWDAEAATNQWPDRTDDERFKDNADYLFRLMTPPPIAIAA